MKEASLDPNGTIIYFSLREGTIIQTNRKDLLNSNEPREIARWKAALEELRNENLIAEKGYKHEIFNVTARGFEFADIIELQAP